MESGIDIKTNYNPYQNGKLNESDQIILNTHLELLKPYFDKESYVLDAGCGLGQTTKELSKHFKFIVGIDSSSSNIEESKRINNEDNILYLVDDVNNIRFSDECFDIVISSEVIEHVKDYDKMLLELKRMGHKDTVYSLSTPNLNIWFYYPRYWLYMLRHPIKSYNILTMNPETKKQYDRWISPTTLIKSIRKHFQLIDQTTNVYFKNSLLSWIYQRTPLKKYVGIRYFILFKHKEV